MESCSNRILPLGGGVETPCHMGQFTQDGKFGRYVFKKKVEPMVNDNEVAFTGYHLMKKRSEEIRRYLIFDIWLLNIWHLNIWTSEHLNIHLNIGTWNIWAGNLRTHLKTHSGEKLNKCNQCEFAFSETGYLRTHMKIHRGEKLNKCKQCDYASSDGSNLGRLLKTHHGEKFNKCNQHPLRGLLFEETF